MHKEEFNALLHACKYSYQPNLLGYCGPKEAHAVFLQFIKSPNEKNSADAEKMLSQFYGCYSYLHLIAECSNLHALDEAVVEAYWLGNDLLQNVNIGDLRRMILTEFTKPGLLPGKIAEQKAASVSKEMLCHHSFHVLHINFITKKLQPLVQTLSNCLIQWGKVLEKNSEERKILVKGIELFSHADELKLRERQKQIDYGFVEEPQINDFVSIHWNAAIEILNKNSLKHLKQYTMQNLQAVAFL